MGLLNIQHKILAYKDAAATGNPQRRVIDWVYALSGFTVNNPRDDSYTIAPGASLQVFSGSRSTSIDGTTQFTTSKNPILVNTYRFTSGSGTAPVLRTDRAINLSTLSAAMVTNNDGTQTLTITGGSSPLAAVQIGDTLFIPGVSTGDTAGPFSPSNEGAWVVLVNGTSSCVLQRPGAFSGLTETVTVASQGQVMAFSAAGVQLLDKVDVTAGFAVAIQGSYVVSQVTPKWFEVVSANPIPAQTATPTAAGLQFYTGLKSWLRVEVDQNAVVQFNGDTGSFNRLRPIVAGDPVQTGWLDKFGSVFSLTVINSSSVTLNLLVQSAE